MSSERKRGCTRCSTYTRTQPVEGERLCAACRIPTAERSFELSPVWDPETADLPTDPPYREGPSAHKP